MSEEKLYDLSQLEAVASGSQEFIDKMVDMFINMSPDLINRIKTGLADQDWEEVRSAAHKMKPSIDMMGISSLTGKIREIEGNAKTQENLEDIPELVNFLETEITQVSIQLKNRN
ncbi:Hpt domain-containing protein [bacterium]|nr:Hpt domain-containing protein [bacterium]